MILVWYDDLRLERPKGFAVGDRVRIKERNYMGVKFAIWEQAFDGDVVATITAVATEPRKDSSNHAIIHDFTLEYDKLCGTTKLGCAPAGNLQIVKYVEEDGVVQPEFLISS